MKKYLTSLIWLFFVFSLTWISNCKKNEDPISYSMPYESEEIVDSLLYQFNGFFKGTVIYIFGNTINGSGFVHADTTATSLEISNAEFERITLGASGMGSSCKGKIDVIQNQLLFESNDCDCFCDCSPSVDCGGDIILGALNYEFQNDTLKMWSSGQGVDTVSFPGIEIGYMSERYFELIKE